MSNDESTPDASLSAEWGGEGEGVKRCYKCLQIKPTTAFNKNKARKDGLQAHCKTCHTEIARVYRATHAEKHQEYKRAWRATNADSIRQYNQQ